MLAHPVEVLRASVDSAKPFSVDDFRGLPSLFLKKYCCRFLQKQRPSLRSSAAPSVPSPSALDRLGREAAGPSGGRLHPAGGPVSWRRPWPGPRWPETPQPPWAPSQDVLCRHAHIEKCKQALNLHGPLPQLRPEVVIFTQWRCREKRPPFGPGSEPGCRSAAAPWAPNRRPPSSR